MRVSNNGISAIIDQNGHIIKSSTLNQVSEFTYELKITKTDSYIYFHNLFSYYLVFLFVFLLVFSRKNFYAK